MTHVRANDARSVGEWTRRAGALILVAGTAIAAPGTPPPKPVELLRVASDEPLVLRLGTPVRASRLGSQSMRIVAEGTNESARGQYVAGTFLKDKDTGFAKVVDPAVYREAVQVKLGVSRDDARTYVERILARHEATGGRSSLEALNAALNSADLWRGLAELGGSYYTNRLATLPQQDASAPESWRTARFFSGGDDALWAAHMAGDQTAFAKLAADARFERFWHAPDPLTGRPRLDSDMRRREHRRVLFDRRPATRALTFVPDVPEANDFVGLGYAANARYRVTLSRPLPGPVALFSEIGARLAVHRRAAVFETTGFGEVAVDPSVETRRFALSELDQGSWRITDVTPPVGETLVDPTTDWEDPDDRHHVAPADRRPFKIRIRFNKPLDPSTVNPTMFTVTMTQAGIGGPNWGGVSIPVPCGVRLHQTRLGAVEVDVAPAAPLDPAAQFMVTAKSVIRPLSGRSPSTDFVFSFTTAPAPEPSLPPVGFDDDFSNPTWWNWHEADVAHARVLQPADAARDQDGRGLFVPFVPGDSVPVSAIETGPIDSNVRAAFFRLLFDDPATPETEGTSIHAPSGATVRVFLNTAPADTSAYGPNEYLWSGWTEFDAANPLVRAYRQFFKLRVEFTLPLGATPDALDLPSIDRLTARAERP